MSLYMLPQFRPVPCKTDPAHPHPATVGIIVDGNDIQKAGAYCYDHGKQVVKELQASQTPHQYLDIAVYLLVLREAAHPRITKERQ